MSEERILKVYVYTRRQDFDNEEILGVASSMEKAKTCLRSYYPHMRLIDNEYVSGITGAYILDIHPMEVDSDIPFAR